MARMARIVIPNIPHHVTQRGNRSQKVFFSNQDKAAYLNLLYKYAQDAGLSFWAYCTKNPDRYLGEYFSEVLLSWEETGLLLSQIKQIISQAKPTVYYDLADYLKMFGDR